MENIWMVLQQTAAASLAALFLLILQRIFLDKLSPRWQYGVWLVLLLRLLVPAGFGGRPTVLDVTFWVETLRTRVELGLNSAYSTPFAASLPAAPVPLLPAGAPASWTDWAFLIYCAGVVLWAAWFVVSAVLDASLTIAATRRLVGLMPLRMIGLSLSDGLSIAVKRCLLITLESKLFAHGTVIVLNIGHHGTGFRCRCGSRSFLSHGRHRGCAQTKHGNRSGGCK